MNAIVLKPNTMFIRCKSLHYKFQEWFELEVCKFLVPS